jgi:hypothetical protein
MMIIPAMRVALETRLRQARQSLEVDMDLADEVEISASPHKKRRGVTKSERSAQHNAAGESAKTLKGVPGPKKTTLVMNIQNRQTETMGLQISIPRNPGPKKTLAVKTLNRQAETIGLQISIPRNHRPRNHRQMRRSSNGGSPPGIPFD